MACRIIVDIATAIDKMNNDIGKKYFRKRYVDINYNIEMQIADVPIELEFLRYRRKPL